MGGVGVVSRVAGVGGGEGWRARAAAGEHGGFSLGRGLNDGGGFFATEEWHIGGVWGWRLEVDVRLKLESGDVQSAEVDSSCAIEVQMSKGDRRCLNVKHDGGGDPCAVWPSRKSGSGRHDVAIVTVHQHRKRDGDLTHGTGAVRLSASQFIRDVNHHCRGCKGAH